MIIDIDENRKMARLHSENNVYTFILEIRPNGMERTYNGFIVKVNDDSSFEFFDVVKNMIIFCLIEKCSIENSNGKIISEEEARKRYKKWRDENNG